MEEREIDFLIFQHIFENEKGYVEWLKEQKDELNLNLSILKRYSTKIEDAWKVIEKVKESRFSIRNKFINNLQDLTTPGQLKERGDMISSGWILFYIDPEIICKAALKAYGVEIN